MLTCARAFRPPPLHALRYIFFTYNGHACPNVLPCDDNTYSGLVAREFDGTVDCPQFDVPMLNVFSVDYVAPVMHNNAAYWLTSAGRRDEAAWVAAHRDAVEQGMPTSLGLVASTKDECHPGKNPEQLRPRIIFSCSAAAAVYFNPVMFGLVQFWKTHRLDHLCPAFGMTRDEVGDWLERARACYVDPALVEDDCTAWDACVHLQGLGLEMAFCRHFTDASSEWLALYEQQYTRSARSASGSIRYERVGGRISGVGNTSFGNTYLNLCMHKAAAKDIQCHMLALGDDIIVVCEARHAAELCSSFEKELTRWGFKPKAKWNTQIELAEFCSSYIAHTTCGRLTLVPKTGKQILKAVRAYDYAHYSAISAGIFSSSPDPLLKLIWSRLPPPDDVPAERQNPHALLAGSRAASWQSVEARYGPVMDVPVLIGNKVTGDSQCLDAIFARDFPGLSGPFTAHPFPPRLKRPRVPKHVAPDPRARPCYHGQMEEPDWIMDELLSYDRSC